jgi:GNAT superfamily N-acetyltransferase
MQSLTFRNAHVNDTNDILEALQSLAIEQGLKDRYVLTSAKLHAALFSASAFAEALLALMDDKLAGLALFSPTNRSFDLFDRPGLYIHSLYVSKPFRRQGIGRELIDKIKEAARMKNYGRIDWIKLKSNSVGSQFYQAIDEAMVLDYIDYMRISL